MYTSPEIEYSIADSTRISITIHGSRLAPSIRDTIIIRMTIITVNSTVVATDSAYELSVTGLKVVYGIGSGVTSRPNSVIPRAENVT
jgi:hypothetical protein